MLLIQRLHAFNDAAWTFELKYDGYRTLAEFGGGKATLQSRNGADATRWFGEVARSLADVRTGPHVTDGEVCVLDQFGRSDFETLQARARVRGWREGLPNVVYCVFDLLVHRGRSLMEQPLYKRQAQLAKLFAPSLPSVLLVTGVPSEGVWLYQQAVALRIEGIVAKRLDSVYRPGVRSPDWLKIKRPGAVPAERWRR
jgi:bifunctional non-homologous end joining protein LigD